MNGEVWGVYIFTYIKGLSHKMGWAFVTCKAEYWTALESQCLEFNCSSCLYMEHSFLLLLRKLISFLSIRLIGKLFSVTGPLLGLVGGFAH
jgi:hypothetical protein